MLFVSGSIYDLTGSYDLPFFIAGVLLIVSAILSFLVPLVATVAKPEQPNPDIVRDENQDVLSEDQESVV